MILKQTHGDKIYLTEIDDFAPPETIKYAKKRLEENISFENGGLETLQKKIDEFENIKMNIDDCIREVKQLVGVGWSDVIDKTNNQYLYELALSGTGGVSGVLSKKSKEIVETIRDSLPYSLVKRYANLVERLNSLEERYPIKRNS